MDVGDLGPGTAKENLLRHIQYAMRSIQRAVASVENDRFTPASSAPEITDYLIDLAVRHPDDGSEFSKFVLLLPSDAIQTELLRQLLPEKIRQQACDYRTKHESLQSQKETSIVEKEFDGAAQARDQQLEIAKSIRELIAGHDFVVTPELIDSVLRSLGYDGLTS